MKHLMVEGCQPGILGPQGLSYSGEPDIRGSCSLSRSLRAILQPGHEREGVTVFEALGAAPVYSRRSVNAKYSKF